jgi:uncharacterized protein DUF389
VVVAVAGIAGVLSLTSAESGALVGVFIPVTTVPAVADMAVSLALSGSTEFGRAALQLGLALDLDLDLDLAGILAAAVVTLALQRALRQRVPRVVPRIEAAIRTRLRA